ncbi:hypothetical protein Ahy_A01g003385 isoform A [Arachis hypogaea]|uniref:Uncharacterized protein n=1 Tax=Arachis hypogaea TaxID=3818 RepID=A0A445ESV3_ARAHY|nr:hypothetical protein Ahy_A01g003385 isoform A [Arachis hypogaea]
MDHTMQLETNEVAKISTNGDEHCLLIRIHIVITARAFFIVPVQLLFRPHHVKVLPQHCLRQLIKIVPPQIHLLPYLLHPFYRHRSKVQCLLQLDLMVLLQLCLHLFDLYSHRDNPRVGEEVAEGPRVLLRFVRVGLFEKRVEEAVRANADEVVAVVLDAALGVLGKLVLGGYAHDDRGVFGSGLEEVGEPLGERLGRGGVDAEDALVVGINGVRIMAGSEVRLATVVGSSSWSSQGGRICKDIPQKGSKRLRSIFAHSTTPATPRRRSNNRCKFLILQPRDQH